MHRRWLLLYLYIPMVMLPHCARREQDVPEIHGVREFYSLRDLGEPHRDDPLDVDKHIITMVDVDYYVPKEDWTANYLVGHPILIFTFAPTRPSGLLPNESYSIDNNNFVTYTVYGGLTTSRTAKGIGSTFTIHSTL